jgi:hypothetical protein
VLNAPGGSRVIEVYTGVGFGESAEDCLIEAQIISEGDVIPRQGRVVFNEVVTREYKEIAYESLKILLTA